MSTQDKLAVGALWLCLTFGLFVLGFFTFAPKNFEGYYLREGAIYASFDWSVDQKAFPFMPVIWKDIVDNNLHVWKNISDL